MEVLAPIVHRRSQIRGQRLLRDELEGEWECSETDTKKFYTQETAACFTVRNNTSFHVNKGKCGKLTGKKLRKATVVINNAESTKRYERSRFIRIGGYEWEAASSFYSSFLYALLEITFELRLRPTNSVTASN